MPPWNLKAGTIEEFLLNIKEDKKVYPHYYQFPGSSGQCNTKKKDTKNR